MLEFFKYIVAPLVAEWFSKLEKEIYIYSVFNMFIPPPNPTFFIELYLN